jgi:trimeric autotransporter adhesin
MIKYYLLINAVFFTVFGRSQVSISPTPISPNTSAMLDIIAPNKGMLIPRMDMMSRNNILTPANSLLIFQTDNNPGYYFNNGSPALPQWIKLEDSQSLLLKIGRIPIETLPFTISQPGSYYLTKSFVSTSGIMISASNVFIDLNGNTMTGALGNTSAGISTTSFQNNITILNGNITGWGKEGINVSNSSAIALSYLTVSGNTLDGIFSGNKTLAAGLNTHNNGQDGVDFGETSVLSSCVSDNNGGDGIEMDHGAVIKNCSAKNNVGVGIKTTNLSNVSDCTAHNNISHGFQIGTGSNAFNNISLNNGSSGFYILSSSQMTNNNSKSNSRHGYELVGNDCVIHSNNAQGNTLAGFNCAFDRCQFISNTSNFNNTHGFDIAGNNCLIIKNSCSSNVTSAFTVGGTNTIATVISALNINMNSNPNANTSF